jgi:PTS system fructose-specific IIC component
MPALITTDLVALDADLGADKAPSSAGWPSWSPTPAGRPAPTRCTPTPWPARPRPHRAARRHRHPALPLRRGHRGLPGLRPALPKVDFGAPDGPADLVFLIAAPEHGDADHLTLLTALARALVRPEFVASLRVGLVRRGDRGAGAGRRLPRSRRRAAAAADAGGTAAATRRPPPRVRRPGRPVAASSWSAPARPASRTPTWPPTS